MTRTILFTIISMFYSSVFGQTLENKYAEDVKSINAIIDAYYDVISGSSQDPWQFERDKYIHAEGAVITRWDENGKVGPYSLEEEYISLLLFPKEDWFEKELKRKVSQYGNIAQVWSAFEVRTNPDVESTTRGINSIQLYFEKGRWWISSWTGVMESDQNNVVFDFLNEN
ncbi:hypothetical protein [Flagellimonas sp.]|uniref:hypothetical protein n=1 Tax=Flagellimonas sp. TaxID=2058762 RepID=UPI003F49E6F6